MELVCLHVRKQDTQNLCSHLQGAHERLPCGEDVLAVGCIVEGDAEIKDWASQKKRSRWVLSYGLTRKSCVRLCLVNAQSVVAVPYALGNRSRRYRHDRVQAIEAINMSH